MLWFDDDFYGGYGGYGGGYGMGYEFGYDSYNRRNLAPVSRRAQDACSRVRQRS